MWVPPDEVELRFQRLRRHVLTVVAFGLAGAVLMRLLLR